MDPRPPEPGKNLKKIPSRERIETALKNAEDLPRATTEEKVSQFGNNFYIIFMCLRESDTSISDNAIMKVYADRAKSLGEPWQRFLSENARLIDEINKVLAQERIYSELFRIFTDFYVARDFEAGDAFNKKVDPELGIQAIRIPIWKKLNELLPQAAEAMRKVGIEPEKFYG